MIGILYLSFKKIFRANKVVILFLSFSFLSLLYLSIYTKDFPSNFKFLNLAISYACLLLTGGQLRDEVESGFLDVIIHRISKERIVIGKFLSVFLFSFFIYLLLFTIIFISHFIFGNIDEFKTLSKMAFKGFAVTVYLVSIGLFLSLYLKGYFNFVFVFFMEFASLIFMDLFNLIENFGKLSPPKILLISLFFPHIPYTSDNIFVFSGLLMLSFIFLLLTINLFKRMEIKRG